MKINTNSATAFLMITCGLISFVGVSMAAICEAPHGASTCTQSSPDDTPDCTTTSETHQCLSGAKTSVECVEGPSYRAVTVIKYDVGGSCVDFDDENTACTMEDLPCYSVEEDECVQSNSGLACSVSVTVSGGVGVQVGGGTTESRTIFQCEQKPASATAYGPDVSTAVDASGTI